MNILLTGATGVFGSSLLASLLECGYDVTCLKRTSSSFKREFNRWLGSVFWYNLDEINIEKVFREKSIDVVIYTATNYGKETSEFYETYDANLTLPTTLLRLACKYRSKAFISTGTFFDKELLNKPLSRQDVYMDAYVKSKHIFEYIAVSGITKTETTFINMRLEHVYGLDSRRKFVNFVLESLKNNVHFLELSEGTQYRDWIYIDDVVQAYLTVLSNLDSMEKSKSYVFEVGTGEVHTVREFVELCKNITGARTELLFGAHPINNTEILFSKADISNLECLGWRPKYTIEKGIKEILLKMR